MYPWLTSRFAKHRPWLLPWQAPAGAITAVITRCPSGALQFTRKDGGVEEAIPDKNQITVSANGPPYGRANAMVNAQPETRFDLCRCDHSASRSVLERMLKSVFGLSNL